jgi:hypothetical protein
LGTVLEPFARFRGHMRCVSEGNALRPPREAPSGFRAHHKPPG